MAMDSEFQVVCQEGPKIHNGFALMEEMLEDEVKRATGGN